MNNHSYERRHQFGLLPRTDLTSSMDSHPSGDISHKSTFLVFYWSKKLVEVKFLKIEIDDEVWDLYRKPWALLGIKGNEKLVWFLACQSFRYNVKYRVG